MSAYVLVGVLTLAMFALAAWAPLGADLGRGVCSVCGRRTRLLARQGLATCRACRLTSRGGH